MMNFRAWSLSKVLYFPEVTKYALAAFGNTGTSLEYVNELLNCSQDGLLTNLSPLALGCKIRSKVFWTAPRPMWEPCVIYPHSFSLLSMLKYFYMVNKLRMLTLVRWTVEEHRRLWIFIRMWNWYFTLTPASSGLVGSVEREQPP